jgi:hypothetical protein
MSRRRVRSVDYRLRRMKRHAGRHYFIDEPVMAMLPNQYHPGDRCSCRDCLPHVGSRVTEYRRGVVVSVDIDPGTVTQRLIDSGVSA